MSEYKTLEEERAALQKRIEEIDKENGKETYQPGLNVAQPKTDALYDWSKAPEWARYCATDECGDVWWYASKPVIDDDDDYDVWDLYRGRAEYSKESVMLRNVPWDQSLEQRPEGA